MAQLGHLRKHYHSKRLIRLGTINKYSPDLVGQLIIIINFTHIFKNGSHVRSHKQQRHFIRSHLFELQHDITTVL
jgi:hypothetical protein